jgi:uncharacterized membrane protein
MENKKQGALEENATESLSRQPETDQAEQDSKAPVAVTVPEDAKEPLAPRIPAVENSPQAKEVRVAPHLSELITGIALPLEEEERAKEQRNLDHTIHQLLIVGLAISVSFMLLGLFLDLILNRTIPTAIPNLGEIFTRVASLRPSGFLSLGLLVLIATPVVRVVGSFIAFIYERDWRYAGITFLVLLVVICSIVIGKE